MASGIQVDDECKDKFNKIKMEKCYSYILFKISQDWKRIVVEKTVPPGATYDDFVADLKCAEEHGECRYAILDCEYPSAQSGNMKKKLLFFYWGPDSCKIKQKMVYSASKDALQRELGDGIAYVIQANDLSDLDWDTVHSTISKSDRI